VLLYVFTGSEVCFAEVSAGARDNPRTLRRVSSVDAGIDPRTQATITTTSGRMCPCARRARLRGP
jgi:hypothetical protein